MGEIQFWTLVRIKRSKSLWPKFFPLYFLFGRVIQQDALLKVGSLPMTPEPDNCEEVHHYSTGLKKRGRKFPKNQRSLIREKWGSHFGGWAAQIGVSCSFTFLRGWARGIEFSFSNFSPVEFWKFSGPPSLLLSPARSWYTWELYAIRLGGVHCIVFLPTNRKAYPC